MQEEQPRSLLEATLIEEVAVCLWKIQIADALMLRQISARGELSTVICEAYFDLAKQRAAGRPASVEFFDELKNFTWDCQQLVLSTSTSTSARARAERTQSSDPTFTTSDQNLGNGSLEVKLGNSADNLVRYANGWRRDLHRVLARLKELRSEE